MNIRKIVTFSLAAAMLVSASGCGVASVNKTGASAASSSAESSAAWLTERLGASAEGITVGTESDAEKYGVSLEGLRDEGYVIRKAGGEAVIFGKTEDGLDRGVRYYAKNFADVETASYTYGEGYSVKKLTIAGNDISNYSIMLPETSDECHLWSAQSLQKYIGDACGFYPEIVEYSADASNVIMYERVYPEDEKYAELGDEGFTVSVGADENLIISGGYYRGCMYGTFRFLEDYIGYRFLYDHENYDSYTDKNDGIIDYLYENDHIDIPAGTNETQVPSFSFRENVNRGAAYASSDYRVMRGENGNTVRNRDRIKYNGYNVIKAASHGVDTSGIYKELTGITGSLVYAPQPCYTDEYMIELSKDVYVNQVYARLASGEEIGKEIIDVDVSQIDSGDFCMCDNCMEYYELDGLCVGAVLYYTNIMADTIKNEFGDGINVAMLSYYGTMSVPKVTKPRDNVSISYCLYNDLNKFICYNHCVDGHECSSTSAVSNKIYGEELRGWCEITDNINVWYYPGYWFYSSTYAPVTRTLKEDLQFLKECGVDGMYVCVSGFHMADEKIIPYLLTKLLWDVDISDEEYEDLIREYYMIMYGDGYEEIYEFHKRVENYGRDTCWTTMIWKNPAERIDLYEVANGFLYDVALFDRARELASSNLQEQYVRKLSLQMYFTGLVAVHTDWYLDGTEESKKQYEELYNYFVDEAVSQIFLIDSQFEFKDYVDKLDITKNLAELYNEYDSHAWWVPYGHEIPAET